MPNALRIPPRRKPPVLVVVLGFVLAAGGTVSWGWHKMAALHGLFRSQAEPPARARAAGPGEAPDKARHRRQSAVAELAPSAMPSGLPLLGDEGLDDYGMPTQYVDRPALRSLLLHKEYVALNGSFEQFQQSFELDHRKEYWATDAGAAFDSAEPALRTQLDAWVTATPDAFAPYVARGYYWLAVAWARRGSKWAKDTDDSDFAAMAETLPLAMADFDRAREIQPKAISAYRGEIKVFLGMSRKRQARRLLDAATAFCPSCFQVRVAYMIHLRPRWHGSREEMAQFAASVDSSNKKLQLLRGYVDWDEAQTLSGNKDYAKAMAAIERACALGTHWEFLLERSNIHRRLKDNQAALEDASAAWAARPGEPDILARRMVVLRNLARWEAAGSDLLALLRTDPTDDHARGALDTVVKGLIFEGWEHHKAGHREDALRVLDLAAELQPQNREIIQRRGYIVEGLTERPAGPTGAPGVEPPEMDGLKQAVLDNPDDLRAHQQLDYNLARQGKFTEVVALWDSYLERNPKDGRAYLERGGAYFHLRKVAEAKADAAKACDLGISEGCLHAK
jgi:tetratricopeptide (TPR) repeat protein